MRAVVAFIFLFLSAGTHAASFDCNKASTPVEKAICADPVLSSLDDNLSSVYRAALKLAPDPNLLKSQQRAWLVNILKNCTDTTCIANAYQSRINSLSPENTVEPMQAEPPAQIVPQEAIAQPDVHAPTPSSAKTEADIQTAPKAAPPPPMSQNNPVRDSQENGIKSIYLKVLGAILVVNAIITIALHKQDKLIIYRDYTDATFTGVAPLLAIMMYFIMRFFEISEKYSLTGALVLFSLLMIFVITSTARNNNGIGLKFVMSLATKLTIVGIYYAIMAMLIFGSGSARKKGERQAAYEARRRREAKANAAAMVATTTGFVALSAWVCKYSEFTPLEEYFSPASTE